VVDLSSSLDEEGHIPDTSCDEEFTRRLFSDLNRDVLLPPDNDKVIILIDSNGEEEEAGKEDAAGAKATPSSAVGILASTASTVDADEAPKGVQNDNSGDRTPDWEVDGGNNDEEEADLP
jgi:hypothetical protein